MSNWAAIADTNIQSVAFKNAASSFFGGKPFRLLLPDLSGPVRDDRLVCQSTPDSPLGGQVHAVDGAGHMAHHAAAEEVLVAIAAFERLAWPAAPDDAM